MSLDTFEERLDNHIFENWYEFEPSFEAEDPDDNVIEMPHLFNTRDYQNSLYNALLPHDGSEPVKRAVEVWHRRAGKDKTVWNITITRATIEVGYYLYLFPTQAQAKKAIWLGRGGDKIKFMDHIPEHLVANKNKTEMYIELTNGSIIQLGGSDNYDAYMGTNPIWIVFSEWAICNPVAWDYFRPILVENGGTAIFIYTPRGRNHGYITYKRAVKGMRADPTRWHCSLLSYKTTGVLTEEQVRREVEEEGMSKPKAQQEFECSFEARRAGAIFGEELETARREERIGFVKVEKGLSVYTAWDIGRDTTAIWFFQKLAREIRLVHYHQDQQKNMPHYINYVKRWAIDNDVVLGNEHLGPHDLGFKEYTRNVEKTRAQIARDEHQFNFKVVARTSEEEGVDAIKRIFPQLFIDEVNCMSGIGLLEVLEFPVKKGDEDKPEDQQERGNIPGPKWASHAGKALQYLSQGVDDTFNPSYVDPLESLRNAQDFDVFD